MRCGDLSDGLLWEVVNGRGEMQFEMLEWMDWLGWGVLIPFCLVSIFAGYYWLFK